MDGLHLPSHYFSVVHFLVGQQKGNRGVLSLSVDQQLSKTRLTVAKYNEEDLALSDCVLEIQVEQMAQMLYRESGFNTGEYHLTEFLQCSCLYYLRTQLQFFTRLLNFFLTMILPQGSLQPCPPFFETKLKIHDQEFFNRDRAILTHIPERASHDETSKGLIGKWAFIFTFILSGAVVTEFRLS